MEKERRFDIRYVVVHDPSQNRTEVLRSESVVVKLFPFLESLIVAPGFHSVSWVIGLTEIKISVVPSGRGG